MAGKFSFSDQVNMLLVLGFCEGNCRRKKHFPMLKDGLEKQASFSVALENVLLQSGHKTKN
ncbi:hypothetical protein NQ318_003658 [Aromia moschata]|uniref:Uncharacterized protein n=1 Tax=Aromia moschata TaxID=1265417 RepID=A0AAV8Y1A2_9CUCU|nr:hypothetical protein NQ318_003658 [Aromia moschata]